MTLVTLPVKLPVMLPVKLPVKLPQTTSASLAQLCNLPNFRSAKFEPKSRYKAIVFKVELAKLPVKLLVQLPVKLPVKLKERR